MTWILNTILITIAIFGTILLRGKYLSKHKEMI